MRSRALQSLASQALIEMHRSPAVGTLDWSIHQHLSQEASLANGLHLWRHYDVSRQTKSLV